MYFGGWGWSSGLTGFTMMTRFWTPWGGVPENQEVGQRYWASKPCLGELGYNPRDGFHSQRNKTIAKHSSLGLTRVTFQAMCFVGCFFTPQQFNHKVSCGYKWLSSLFILGGLRVWVFSFWNIEIKWCFVRANNKVLIIAPGARTNWGRVLLVLSRNRNS